MCMIDLLGHVTVISTIYTKGIPAGEPCIGDQCVHASVSAAPTTLLAAANAYINDDTLATRWHNAYIQLLKLKPHGSCTVLACCLGETGARRLRHSSLIPMTS